jgi:hypothetical protein
MERFDLDASKMRLFQRKLTAQQRPQTDIRGKVIDPQSRLRIIPQSK